MRILRKLGGAGLLVLFVALVILRLLAAMRESGGALTDNPPGRFLETPLGRLHALEAGPEDGPMVLLVHGAVGWSGLWAGEMARLAAAGYRAVAIDLPPMGYSDRTPGDSYRRTDQAARILAAVRALGGRPVLVAHSFGAAAATAAVLKAPEAFRGYVIVDGALGLDDRAPAWPLGAALALWPVNEALVSATITNFAATETLLKQFLYRKGAATDEILAILRQPLSREGTTAALARWLPTLIEPRPDTRAALGVIRLPVEILWGDRDSTTPLAQAEELVRLIPKARLTVLKDVGHIPQIEDPEAFHAALLSALENLRAAP